MLGFVCVLVVMVSVPIEIEEGIVSLVVTLTLRLAVETFIAVVFDTVIVVVVEFSILAVVAGTNKGEVVLAAVLTSADSSGEKEEGNIELSLLCNSWLTGIGSCGT